MRRTFPPRQQVFTWYGVLSGILFVASSAHAVTAIALVGLATATGVWCGTAVLVSFGWGVAVAGDEVAHPGRAAAALALILAGIAGIVASAAGGGAGAQPGETLSTEPAALADGPDGEVAGGAAGWQWVVSTHSASCSSGGAQPCFLCGMVLSPTQRRSAGPTSSHPHPCAA